MFRMTDVRRADREAGFTLIELSIVLVLVGLLIGGILKGQELINGTRVKTQVSQIDALRAAVNTFQDKYMALPGDARNASFPGFAAATGGGTRGNGLIGPNAGVALNANLTAVAGNEPSVALEHLSVSGLLGGIQADPGTRSAVAQLPGKLSSSFMSLGAFQFNVNGANSLQNGVRVAGGTGYTATPIASAADAGELDLKYDDGDGSTGTIQADGNGGVCHANGVYATTTGPNCSLAFRLF